MKIAKKILGILIGIGLAVFLFSKIDFNEALKYKDRIQPIYLIPYAIFGFFIHFFLCLRGFYIYNKKVNIQKLILIRYISNAAVLFARRLDDVIQTYTISQKSKESYLSTFFKINIAKLLSLLVYSIGGISALVFIDTKNHINTKAMYLLILFLVLFFILSSFRHFFYKYFLKSLNYFFSFFNQSIFFKEKIKPYFDYIIAHTTFRYLFYPTIISVLIHLVLDYFSIFYAGKMLGIQFSYWETLFLSMLVNLSFLVPFVPLGGIGVYHAAIVSSFLVIGKTQIEGIAYGVITHLINLFLNGIYGLIAYLFFIKESLRNE